MFKLQANVTQMICFFNDLLFELVNADLGYFIQYVVLNQIQIWSLLWWLCEQSNQNPCIVFPTLSMFTRLLHHYLIVNGDNPSKRLRITGRTTERQEVANSVCAVVLNIGVSLVSVSQETVRTSLYSIIALCILYLIIVSKTRVTQKTCWLGKNWVVDSKTWKRSVDQRGFIWFQLFGGIFCICLSIVTIFFFIFSINSLKSHLCRLDAMPRAMTKCRFMMSWAWERAGRTYGLCVPHFIMYQVCVLSLSPYTLVVVMIWSWFR